MKSSWDAHMVKLGDHWIKNCDNISKKEGWALFDADGVFQIQAIDEPEPGEGKLDSDGSAYSLCVKKAFEGSKVHLLALFLDGKLTDEETFVPKYMIG